MEKSSFFNSINHDRRYKAEEFAEYFASFIGDGIFPNPSTNLQVLSNNDMTVNVKQGKAWIKGYFYVNTDDLKLKIDVADGVLSRVDRIVLRKDVAQRKIYCYVKKGQFASSPVAPALQRDADMYELGLADIYVRAGVISIIQSNITDLRLDSTYCGIVHGTVDQIDVTTLFNQYTTKFKLKEEEFETEFKEWIEQLKDVLEGDVAGNLLNLINTNKDNIDKLQKATTAQLADITTDNKRLTKDKTITGAINELFTSANNGKKLISDVVGNPLLATDTFQQQHDKIQILKNTFVTNLSKKEQGASSTENLQDLISKINNINVGKKWAEGTGKARESSNKEVCMSVTDLDFSPKTVIINTRSDTYREPYIAIDCTLFKYKTQGWYSGGYIILDDGYVHKNNRGFDFYASNGHISKDTTFQWIAFE
ncbi:hypothetical protein ACP49_16170 [Clostridium botulinum]|uniref:hypothetical protein n=1 Tax=Clostridium botulinum TaxID=1491 RepID=UPI0006A71F07|nr:hypothetical protein [Clostridium botulinum]KOM97068.1 hypothetical protein ACP53_11345 [Clostridium botulinum]KOM99485.1 hypothetical protein ACP49_16170 [Clostridium botulinum]MCR1147226.1 hypothetical protein [Clostridium botulinum]NFH94502.1 hypothetical protein [Clostridium botulinum]NFH97415.1 hypothetical protein [Clostridium botulinum]